MRFSTQSRRSFLIKTGLASAAIITSPMAVISVATAKDSFSPTQSMRGGSNNYSPNAPLVGSLGEGFFVHGTVRRAGTGEPLPNIRIQIWAATTLGGEREPKNHGSILTAEDGTFALETMQIVPNFGEPHAHLAYDDSDFKTVFLRPVMNSVNDTRVQADFVLAEV